MYGASSYACSLGCNDVVILADLLFFAFPIAFAEIRGFSGGITGTTFISIMVKILLLSQ